MPKYKYMIELYSGDEWQDSDSDFETLHDAEESAKAFLTQSPNLTHAIIHEIKELGRLELQRKTKFTKTA